jgi:hypothetical protein
LAFRYPPADTPVADQFQGYTRSAGTVLVYGAIIALLLGFALASLSVWNQVEQFRQFDSSGPGLRIHIVQFMQNFAAYAGIAAILFVGGVLVNGLAWFYSALSADFDDLFDDVQDDDAIQSPPPDRPSDWTRPIGSD